MPALIRICGLSLVLLCGWTAEACSCSGTLSVCNEVAGSDLVFIGTVESITPGILDAWNAAQLPSARRITEETLRGNATAGNGSLESLRKTYLELFPDLPLQLKKQIATAPSTDSLTKLWYGILGRGRLVRLRVNTTFRMGDDDDQDSDDADNPKSGGGKAPGQNAKDKDDDKDEHPAVTTIDVWTPMDDCGVPFQIGETYLVYAADDEETGVISTEICSRTRRISDAGEDLAYLYFLKQNAESSGQIEGYATSNLDFPMIMDRTRELFGAPDPVTDIVVELRSDGQVRYSSPDAKGRFLFDGLPKGDYSLTAYASGYPTKVETVAGPKRIILPKKACSRQVLFVPKAHP
jgi:hypothetical protein